MYTVTFYSFKGGVGRSMSLANIAAELVNRGRKVLVVDFDLEAPGLHTFDFWGDGIPEGGVVDYVEEYLCSNQSPDLMDHVRQCDMSNKSGGELWMMPAGTLNDNYSTRLSSINWHDLYENRSGYLFFEDMKAQWEKKINPDYVLIDSRTGHTDVGGICTRQLPNSVVFHFFPNQQNLVGLKKVVGSINAGKEDDGLKIEKHFVSSNVPDLDDEYGILSDKLNEFSNELSYKKLTAKIHRYNSLALLNQELFTVNRPNTRLAQEYRGLTDEIILKNPEDVDGSISFLNDIIANKDKYSFREASERIKKIKSKHKNNSEILNSLSYVSERSGDYEEALSLLDRSSDLSESDHAILLRKARLELSRNENDKALRNIREALTLTNIDYEDILLSINLLNIIGQKHVQYVLESSAFYKLDEYAFVDVIQSHLIVDTEGLMLAKPALERYISVHSENENLLVKETLGTVLIANGECEEALALLSKERPRDDSDMPLIFNYAMAEWGATEVVPTDLFKIVLDKSAEYDVAIHDANLKQCISLCYWSQGDNESALELLALAEEDVGESSSNIFSCWTYLLSNKNMFLEDVEQLKMLYRGKEVLPGFLNNHESLF